MIRLAICEDHNALIDGIKLFLEYEEDIEVIGFANNGKELLDLVKRKSPHVVISDIRMPVIDGITATTQIKMEYPNVKVIAFTMFDQEEAVEQMLEAGASGYILKNSSLQELLVAIRTVASGKTYFDPQLTFSRQKKPATKGKTVLTRRQIEILKLIAKGKTNNEIADILFIGRTTVETHRKNMIRVLGLQGSGELLRYAIERKYDFR
ncbi:response regulator transcription factor [Ascidiimonas aurantiaca]|uniref:response regulator transcription factor n=1 Tax=Ascidiimonas aurantiaca TaxID=1685432 RepID=UPI0030EF94B2